MSQKQPSGSSNFAELSVLVRNRNQRYLEHLKHSGDPSDARSKLLATILDCVADGLIVLDEKLTIVLSNLAAAQIAGWDLDDVTRDELHRDYQFFSDEGKTPIPFDEEPIRVAMREKRSHEMEGFVVGPHLEPAGRWIRAHAAPVFDDEGKPIGGVTVFSDITERRRLQRQRDCLASLIGHDIKNHLAAEQMFFDYLLSVNASEFNPETSQILRDLRSFSERFLGVAESLMEMSRAKFFTSSEYGQEVEAAPLVDRAVEMTALVATQRRVRILVEYAAGLPMIRCLPAVISHVLHNIIQNAVEASPEGVDVSVAVSANEASLIMKVADTGPGMTAEDVSKLFDPHRVAGHVAQIGHSSGFGLYLSAMLIEGQGGTITCASSPERGTIMTVTMPAVS